MTPPCDSQTDPLLTIGTMTHAVAHEFSNVLMSVQTAAAILKRSADPRAQQAEQLLVNAIGRGRRLIGELRTLKQPFTAQPESLDLTRWIQDVADDLRALLAGCEISLELVRPDAPLLAAADPVLLHHALANLIANGRDATRRGGRLVLTLADRGERFELAVTDDGDGIEPDVLPHIFSLLFTRKRNGTGLGLPIVARIVQSHGGTLAVESEAGAGTTFRIVLPRTFAG